MKEKVIYTIGRQFGSGGRLIGRKLAERLGIPYYDKDLLAIAAKSSGLADGLFKEGEKPSVSLLYSLVSGDYSHPMSAGTLGFNEMPLNDRLFIIQSNTIKQVAAKGSCVIIGRCADYVLRNDPDLVSVFIHAPLKERAKRAFEVYGADKDNAENICLKNDKSRANFYNYYSDTRWGMCDSYTLALDSSLLGVEGAVDAIISYTELRDRKRAGC